LDEVSSLSQKVNVKDLKVTVELLQAALKQMTGITTPDGFHKSGYLVGQACNGDEALDNYRINACEWGIKLRSRRNEIRKESIFKNTYHSNIWSNFSHMFCYPYHQFKEF
jgi:hypothetical protein